MSTIVVTPPAAAARVHALDALAGIAAGVHVDVDRAGQQQRVTEVQPASARLTHRLHPALANRHPGSHRGPFRVQDPTGDFLAQWD